MEEIVEGGEKRVMCSRIRRKKDKKKKRKGKKR